MKKISQEDFEANLAAQTQKNVIDLSHADLSDIAWHGLELSGSTVAMSILRNARFSATQALHGCTWIGNRIENCIFDSTPISKAEILDCTFKECELHAMQFFRVDLSRTVFLSCSFVDIDLSQANSIRARFEDCTFVNTRLTGDFLFTGAGDFEFSADGKLNL